MISDEIRLSKRISFYLRHGAIKAGIPIRTDGYVKVSDLLNQKDFRNVSVDSIRHIVATNDKQRFKLDDIDGQLCIRANQGHTLSSVVSEELLKPVTPEDGLSTVVHGTTYKSWKKIRETGGLLKMQRNHIHLALGLPGEEGVISGMRKQSQVHIFVDVKKAMDAGIPFFRSDNNVILTPGVGDQGILPMDYFEKVVEKSGHVIYPPKKKAVHVVDPSLPPPRYLCVLDYEANMHDWHEIIEWPVHVIDTHSDTLECVGEFHEYVQPTQVKTLNPFATELTGITQETVDRADSLANVMVRFHRFMVENGLSTEEGDPVDCVFVTCGDWDLRTCLPKQAIKDGFEYPTYLKRWINVKINFIEYFNFNKRTGMPGMLSQLQLPLIGRHHSGIDDTRNIAEITRSLLRKGSVFRETGRVG
eukprot:Rmarinus@m.25818